MDASLTGVLQDYVLVLPKIIQEKAGAFHSLREGKREDF
jgi:hypothetical protein